MGSVKYRTVLYRKTNWFLGSGPSFTEEPTSSQVQDGPLPKNQLLLMYRTGPPPKHQLPFRYRTVLYRKTTLYVQDRPVSKHGRPQGGKGDTCPPPLEFEKMASYAAVLQNTLKFSLAPWARRKMVDFLYGATKTCQLFKVSVVLTLWKNFCGCPCVKAQDGNVSVVQVNLRYRTNTFFMHKSYCPRSATPTNTMQQNV